MRLSKALQSRQNSGNIKALQNKHKDLIASTTNGNSCGYFVLQVDKSLEWQTEGKATDPSRTIRNYFTINPEICEIFAQKIFALKFFVESTSCENILAQKYYNSHVIGLCATSACMAGWKGRMYMRRCAEHTKRHITAMELKGIVIFKANMYALVSIKLWQDCASRLRVAAAAAPCW